MTGQIFVITGPSGVGKGTLCSMLLTSEPGFVSSISATIRPMRPGEQEGVHYYFKSRAEFQAMIDHDASQADATRHQLLEWAVYNGHYYGTPRQAVENALDQELNVLLEIETQGAKCVKQKFPSAHQIFIAPPDMAELERRLRGRGTDGEADIRNRLHIAQQEMAQANDFDHIVINHNLADSLAEIRRITQASHTAGTRHDASGKLLS